MKIVADVDLPFLDEMFAGHAEVVRLKASAITAETVRDSGAVIVRSVTKVDRRLLAGSGVRFVGSATIGTDHVDTAWLASSGIGFANAPGCNANAVSEYLIAALLEISGGAGLTLRGSTIGVVGAGSVGSRVAVKAAALGMTVLLNDPPLARSGAPGLFHPIDALMTCDVVTLHVPFTKEGPDATEHLFDGARLAAMKRGAVLVNTARGAVVDTPALAQALQDGHLRAAAVDVWEGEPSVNPSLLDLAAIATAHIAGYSNDGKANASMMMYDAFCTHFGWEPVWRLGDRLPPPEPAIIDAAALVAPAAGQPPGASGPYDGEEIVRRVVRAAYPIRRDDAALRRVAGLPPADRPGYFLRLRNEYPLRREFPATEVRRGGLPGFPDRELTELGFRVI